MADQHPDPMTAPGVHTVYLRDFRFDRSSGRLWCGADEVALRPKAAAVLAALVDRAGEVVRKQDLLDAVWPDGYVGDVALSVCVRELRQALGDDAHQPRFIATAHRRGYRLVADVAVMPPEHTDRARPFVGRADDLATLDRLWLRALSGRRSTCFVAAPAGAGKTALVDEFVGRITHSDPVPLLAAGQCVQLAEPAEPYLPVLQAIAGLWRGPRGAAVAEVLRRCAAGWLVQLPALFDDDELLALRRRVGRTSTPRMLREFAVAVEQVCTLRPVVIVLEDLHDADQATVELISYLARRREPARLLVLATYRPTELIVRRRSLHRVVQDLRARGLAGYLGLELLSPGEVGAYLASRLAPRVPAAQLVAGVHERTEGNALFMVAVCERLLDAGLLVGDRGRVDTPEELSALGIPSEVRLMLEQQVDALEQVDQRVLETAAAVGVEFAADTIRAALHEVAQELSAAQVEDRCAGLARLSSLVRSVGVVEWPDGTVSARYRFTHEMYREILYERLNPARRASVHRAIGQRLRTVHGTHAPRVATELALHFERGHEYAEALRWIVVAAATAVGRSAYPESHAQVTRGLALLDRVHDTSERLRLELGLRHAEVVAAAASWGWRDPAALSACARLQELAEAQRDVAALVAALLGLHNGAMMEGDDAGMRERLQRIDELAGSGGEPAAQLVADLLHLRQDSRAARYAPMWDRARRMLLLCASVDHVDLAEIVGDELDVAAHLYGGLALWNLGYADQARAHAAAALERARDQGMPAGLARALWFAAVIHLLCGEAHRVRELAGELDEVCARHDLGIWRAGAAVLDGWAIGSSGSPTEGLERIRQGSARWLELAGIGEALHQRLAAELYLSLGDVPGGLAATASGLDALARNGGVQSEPELWRLRGELLRLAGPEHAGEADEALSAALDLTTARQTRGFQLRAATSMAGLRYEQGRVDEARDLLASVYDSFTEGHDTHDLAEAQALLAHLG